MTHTIITSTKVATAQKSRLAGKRFGSRFVWFESFVFDTASSLSPEYDGGDWDFHELSNGGFYMVPTSSLTFRVECANGYAGNLSADAFGVTCCLNATSLLSFSPAPELASVASSGYHRLREYAIHHAEARQILAATD